MMVNFTDDKQRRPLAKIRYRRGGMYQGSGSPQPGNDQYMDVIQSVTRWVRGRGTAFWLLLFVIAAVVWLATGTYIVSPREQGVVRLAGKFNSISNPGLHWRPPSPITSLVLVDIESIRTDAVGFRFDDDQPGQMSRVRSEALMLTTDNSIVEAQMVVQYRVTNAAKFIFNVKDPEQVLHTAAEVSLRSIVGRNDLDTNLTVRATIEQDARTFLEGLLRTYDIGILLTNVKLQTMDPPEEVKDAFQEVTRALEDETRLENQASAYRADRLPRAEGRVQVLIREAGAFHQQQVERARGEANRFLALLKEYRESPQVTRERLYLETMEQVLSTTQKVLIDSDVEVLPFLNVAGLKSLETVLEETS